VDEDVIDDPSTTEQVTAQRMSRAAEMRPSSYNEADRTLDVVWSTGAAVMRFDWWDGEYYSEELSMKPDAVRLERLNAGAALLDTHDSWQLRSVIGSVVPGSARIEAGKGIATVRLADTDDVRDITDKIIAGHIRNISIGYMVHQYTRIEKEGERTVMRADDWEPTEISFVPVPADAGAQARSRDASQGGHPCIIRGAPAAQSRNNDMEEDEIQAGAAPVVETPANEQRAVPPAPATVTARRIQDVVTRSDLGADFALELVARNSEKAMTEAELTDAVTTKLEEKRNAAPINGANRVSDPVASGEPFMRAIEGAILSRGKRPSEVDADARMFRGMGIEAVSRFFLEQNGQRTLGMRKEEIFVAACRFGAHGTSDFGTALKNAANKAMVEGYAAAEQTFWGFTKRATLKDFKPASLAGLAALSPFLLVAENGEFKRLTASDFGDTMQLSTYGGIFALTRQAIINDDLGIFANIPEELGRLGAEHESDTIYAILTGNPTMYDTVALFHSSHGNLAGTGTAITIDSIGAGRAAMANQTGEGGKRISGNFPKYLIVGPNQQTAAEQLVAAIVAADTAKVNPFAGKLEAIVDPRITGNQWFLAADQRLSGIVAGYLEGQEEVFLDTREGFDVDGTEWKGRLDYVGKAINWRGLYKNPGQ